MKEKALREHLVNLLSGRGAHVDWKATFSGIPPKMRGVRPSGLPIARAHADRAMGHPGIFSRCETCLTGLARRLLALCASAAECQGLGQKPQIIRAGPRGYEKVGRECQNRPLRGNSPRDRANNPARSSACRGPQRVPSWAGPHGSTSPRQLEIEFAPRKAFQVVA